MLMDPLCFSYLDIQTYRRTMLCETMTVCWCLFQVSERYELIVQALRGKIVKICPQA